MNDRAEEAWVRLIRRLGIEPKSRTETGMLCLCPIHGDVGTASLSVRDDGAFTCFSPSCSARGWGFVRLAIQTGMTRAEAVKVVNDYGCPEVADRSDRTVEADKGVEAVRIGRYKVDWNAEFRRWAGNLPPADPVVARAAAWMFGRRNVSPAALAGAEVGVDRKTGDVVFPHIELDDAGWRRCVGITTRAVDGKRYMDRFETGSRLWLPPTDPRLSMVLVEGQMDALRVRSADCLLGTCAYGAQLSDGQVRLIRMHPGGVTLFMDNDPAGVAATAKALAAIGPHRCRVVIDYHGVKDAGDMTDEQIVTSVASAMDGETYASGPGHRYRIHALKGGRR